MNFLALVLSFSRQRHVHNEVGNRHESEVEQIRFE